MSDSEPNNLRPPLHPGASQQAAIDELQAMLGERSPEWAVRRLEVVSARIFHGEPADPWIRAVLSLRDSGVLAADETVYLLYCLWSPAVDGSPENDPEILSISQRIDALDRPSRHTADHTLSDSW